MPFGSTRGSKFTSVAALVSSLSTRSSVTVPTSTFSRFSGQGSLRVVIDPLPREAARIPADAQLDGCPLERVGKGGLVAVPFVGLLGRAACIDFDNPALADPATKSAHGRAIREQVIAILPAVHAELGVEAVLHGAGVDVANNQRLIAIPGHTHDRAVPHVRLRFSNATRVGGLLH